MHIHERHLEEARKMALVSFAASKVFAMTHAESAEEDFSSLRRKWRKALIEMIGAQPAGQSETETPVSSEAPSKDERDARSGSDNGSAQTRVGGSGLPIESVSLPAIMRFRIR